MTFSWISSFKAYGKSWFTNDHWLEWGGMWILGICAARQIYFESAPGKRLYPNLYLMPVGQPGTGKGELIEAMRSVLVPLHRFTFAPNSATRAAMLDYMADNVVSRIVGGQPYISHECIALNEEFASLVPENDNWYLTTLNELYDCRMSFTARTRTHGIVELHEPYAAVFAAAQPQFLALTFPEQAWGMGFMSRTIMIYSGEQVHRPDLFAERERLDAEREALLDYLRAILDTHGPVVWTPGAKRVLQAWYDAGMPPKPNHPRLTSYVNRRIMHIYKLSIIASLDESTSLQIKPHHAEAAIRRLLTNEARLPQIFLEMGGSVLHATMLDVAALVQQYYIKFNKPLEEVKLIQVLAQRIAPQHITSSLNTMLQAELIKTVGSHPPGARLFVPGTVKGDLLAE